MTGENQNNQPSRRGGKRAGAGRPNGMKNRATPEDKRTITELAKVHAPAALKVLLEISKDLKAPAAARVSASNSLLDRGYGRPVQALEHSGKDGGPLTVEIVRFGEAKDGE